MATDADVIIIGAGMSGLCLAIQLTRHYPKTTFRLIERTDNLGGTWYINSYPGCGCDVPSHFFSYSFALNPNWSQEYAMQPEIEAYYQDVSKKYGVTPHITLNTEVQAAHWEEKSKTWVVHTLDHKSQQSKTLRSHILVSAVGALSTPRECDIPGHENFKGKLFHSARWDHSFDYTNKEIVALGNGCSATQFVPIVSETAKRVTQFSRQPHWLLERPNPKFSPLYKWSMRWIPGLMVLNRARIYAKLEAEFLMMFSDAGKKVRKQLAEDSVKYIQKNAPEKYVPALVPSFEVGCKRRVYDTGYLECLHRDNVELVWKDPVVEIVEHGVKTRSGRVINADAIVLANGFQTMKQLHPMEIRGLNGKSINEHWEAINEGVPQAYFGTCIADFPNFFVMMGPNTSTGHLSVIYTSECQVNFTLRVLDPILRSLHPSPSLTNLLWPAPAVNAVKVTQDAEKADNTWIQMACKKLVFSAGGCTSWYIDPKTKKNAMLYPYWEWHYWLRSVFIKKDDFVYDGKVANYWRAVLLYAFFGAAGAVAFGRTLSSGRLDGIVKTLQGHLVQYGTTLRTLASESLAVVGKK